MGSMVSVEMIDDNALQLILTQSYNLLFFNKILLWAESVLHFQIIR